jgi:hypothetical protein
LVEGPVSATDDQFFRALGEIGREQDETDARYARAAQAILDDLFLQQREFVTDEYPRKSLCTPRRAGKTHTAIAYALYVGLTKPRSDIPIISLTLKNAKALYWRPFQEFSKKYGLGIRFNYSENRAYLLNGSRIFLAGGETRADIEKLRGGAYSLAVIDECKSFNSEVFGELIREILEPATNDVSGSIAVIGTPGAILDGPFYEATCPGFRDASGELVTRDYYRPEKLWDSEEIAPRWNRHYWTVAENVYKPEIWQNALLDKKRNKYTDDNPIWQREYLGQWVSTADTYVYALTGLVRIDGGPTRARCCWSRGSGPRVNKHGLPLDEPWEYIMGVDFGFEDDFAVVVVAYSAVSDVMYHVYDFGHPHMTVPAMAQVIGNVMKRFDNEIRIMIADSGGLGKTLMESLNEMYGFFLEPAEKNEKFDHIELLNSDLVEGKMKILAGSELYEEMSALQWDLRGMNKVQSIRARKIREDRNFANHRCDALLYTWRYCLHHFSRTPSFAPKPETPEWFDDWDAREAELAVHRRDGVPDDVQSAWVSDAWHTGVDLVDLFYDRSYKDH